MSEKIYVPPFKTQGIKTKLVPLIKATVNVDDSITWIEPFMGSAVVGLNIAPHKAIFADLNPHIINFYDQLKNGSITSALVRAYLVEQGSLLSEKKEEHYYFIRERFNKEHNPLDFLFLNRSCFNGMIRFNKGKGYNVPYGHKSERFAKAYVTKIVNQVAHFEQMLGCNDWQFVCQSFEDTIALADENSFIYCDPPYIGRHVDYYDSWNEEQEEQLKTALLSSGARFMLSTWDFNQYRQNPYINTIWGMYQKITQEHFYFVGGHEENRNSMMEALLINYATTPSSP
ncbi:MAG: Dam family site-specific DNA-(adenine-N6)-methyltransferase [Oscillospiraceae bacterium]|jgi:DNA adenine methylase|nr:Dam family site-specific DNA-(adenine-N6)-methyltransferase [Oscillospiraceae bacterium]